MFGYASWFEVWLTHKEKVNQMSMWDFMLKEKYVSFFEKLWHEIKTNTMYNTRDHDNENKPLWIPKASLNLKKGMYILWD